MRNGIRMETHAVFGEYKRTPVLAVMELFKDGPAQHGQFLQGDSIPSSERKIRPHGDEQARLARRDPFKGENAKVGHLTEAP